MITQRTRLDMRPGGVLPVVHVSQYDNDAAALIFDLYDDGELFTVPTGSSVLLNGLKPDNYGFSYQAASISGNTVVCNLTTQMTAVAGAVVCELRVRNGAGTQIIGSCNFILQVEAAALTDDTIISETMIPLIEQAVEIASNLDRYITQTQSNAEIAQEAATTATTAAQSAQIVDANVTGLYNSIEEAKTNANTAAANANTVAANIAAAAARGDYKGDKGDKGDSGITTPVWGMYTMYVDESTGDLWLVTNGEYGSEYWFRYDSETGLLYYCTPDYVEKTVSGELIEITDGADLGALQCKVAFSPIQSGTGDPSPTNVRPISGRTGMTVTACGVNIAQFDNVDNPDRNYFTYTSETAQKIVATSITNTKFIAQFTASLKAGVNYRVSYKKLGASVAVYFYTDRLWGTIEGTYGVNGFTPQNTQTYIIGIYAPVSGATYDIEDFMITLFEESYETYEPYQGTTLTVDWSTEAGTVYGGTLDVVSGVLTVDKTLVTLDGTESGWSVMDGKTGKFDNANINVPAQYNYSSDILFNKYKTGVSYSQVSTVDYTAAVNQTRLILADSRYTTVDEFKASLASEPLTVLLPLATPQTYQLTPTEVRTILGVNNLWSDGDTIEAFTYVSESYDEEG